MSKERDPFQDNDDEVSRLPPKVKGETAKEIIEALESAANTNKTDEKDTGGDLNMLRGSINEFIKKLNSYIGVVFNEEKKKGTRPDRIITLVVGGLAFTLANVYYLLTKNLHSDMSKEEYEETFLNMYRSAVRNIGKNK